MQLERSAELRFGAVAWGRPVGRGEFSASLNGEEFDGAVWKAGRTSFQELFQRAESEFGAPTEKFR